MIYECTDCENCASFDFDFRIICLAEKLSAEAIYEYYPLGEKNATDCPEFIDGQPHEYSRQELDIAEETMTDDENWADALRKWCKERMD